MIDIKLIKENPEEIIRRFKVKGKDAANEIGRILELDGKRRALISETEAQVSNVQLLLAQKWSDLLQGTELVPIDIHTPMWLWSHVKFKIEI